MTLAILLVPEHPDSGGLVHPTFQTLFVGGDPARNDNVLWLGWAFGVAMTVFFASLMAFAEHRTEHLSPLRRPLVWSTALNLLAWTGVVFVYGRSVATPGSELVFAFPPATAIFLYVFFPTTYLFVFLFSLGFRRWILTEEDGHRFQAVLARRTDS